jgi:hypothetical protein
MLLVSLLALVAAPAAAQVFGSITVYHAQGTLGANTASASGNAANYTGAAAYNPTTLAPPPVPTNPSAPQFGIQLGANPVGASISIPAGFFGFSVEMSVANQVLGKNS